METTTESKYDNTFFDKAGIDADLIIDNVNKMRNEIKYIYIHDDETMQCLCSATLGKHVIATATASSIYRNTVNKEAGEANARTKVDLTLTDTLQQLELFHQLRLDNEL